MLSPIRASRLLQHPWSTALEIKSISLQFVTTHRREQFGNWKSHKTSGTVLNGKAWNTGDLSRRNLRVLAMDASDLQEACQQAENAVRLAAKLTQKVQKQLKQNETVSKDDFSPVTVADYGAQALVSWSLPASSPGSAFSMVAEEDTSDFRKESESGMLDRITELVNETLQGAKLSEKLSKEKILELIASGSSQGGSEGRHWVLDPIDGTRGFVGQRQYAICLGLLEKGQVVLGVLGCPNLSQTADENGPIGCLFSAIKGQGAFVSPLFGEADAPKRLKLSDNEDLSQAVFAESYESGHSDQGFTAGLAKKLGVTKPPYRIDSQAKYGAVARGDAAINLRFPKKGYREKIWDHVAGSLIVTEAGAKISDASGKDCVGAPLDFGKGRWLDLDRGIVTATPKVHAAVINAIREMSEESKTADS